MLTHFLIKKVTMKKIFMLFGFFLSLQSSWMGSFLLPTAQAEDSINRMYVAGMAGVVTATGIDSAPSDQPAKPESAISYSGRIGTGLISLAGALLSVGLYAYSFSMPLSGQMGSAYAFGTGRMTPIATEIFLKNVFKTGLSFGGRIGVGLLSYSGTAQAFPAAKPFAMAGSGTSLVVGPFAGYEFQVNKNVSIILDADWTSVNSIALDFSKLGSLTLPAMGFAQLQAGLSVLF